jgi:hypothetical protein
MPLPTPPNIPEGTEPITFVWSPLAHSDYPVAGYYIRASGINGSSAKLFVGDVRAYTLFVNIGDTSFFALVPYYEIWISDEETGYQDLPESSTVEITGQEPTENTRTFAFKFPDNG